MSASTSLLSPAPPSPRTLVICFDGTNSLYGGQNTNVVKFFALLEKEQSDKQLVYYQAGIGTYTNPAIFTPIINFIARMMDEAVAWYLDAHVLSGYQFLMQNYKAGDKICIFGFSRGAYTARALAGMLTKVGLMPPNMPEQLTFAYQMYKDTSKRNPQLSSGFKQTFSRSVPIEFVGVWETVSSVGILFSRHLPFTYSNSIIRTFRHALALDERRARFQPNLWHRDVESEDDAKNDPERSSRIMSTTTDRGRPPTDVQEVWFSGGHSDVGGGAVPDSTENALGNVALRWMVEEVALSQCGIIFNPAALQRANIEVPGPFPNTPLDFREIASDTDSDSVRETLDALAPIDDQLKNPLWWILELLPIINSYQDERGKWHWRVLINIFRSRKIHGDVLLHDSVKRREDASKGKYKPKAKWTGKSRWVGTSLQKSGTHEDEV